MVYVTGDTHGNFDGIRTFCQKNKTSVQDVLVLLGDTGLNYFLDERDDKLKKEVSELPITLFCIRGNHEERPENLSMYKEKVWGSNKVYYEPKYSNILFAEDGGIYNIEGNRCLTIGGAYSIDKTYRLIMGWRWFPQEQITEQEMRYIETYIYDNPNYDYIFTHTCPYNTRPTHLFLSNVNQSTVDTSMEMWFQTLANNLNFTKWYFGHYHGNWINGKYRMLYENIVELGD